MFEFAKEIEERHNGTDSECAVSVIQVSSIIDLGTALKNNDDEFLGYPVIGYHNNMKASGSCLSSPEDGLQTAWPWDPRIKGLFFFQNGISISVSKIGGHDSEQKPIIIFELLNSAQE